MIYAVFDTNIILQGILSETGPAGACIDLLSDGKFKLIATTKTLSELDGILTRPKLFSRYEQLRGRQPAIVLNKIRGKTEIFETPKIIFPFSRDPKDEVFINLALTTDADYLVSRDKDLLDLAKDSEFSTQFPRLKIVGLVGFLEAMRER